MRAILREDTPMPIRITCALAICFAALYSALAAAMYSDRPTVATVLMAIVLVVVGVLALTLASTPRHPRLPLQLALAFTIFAALFVFLGLPLPPTTASVGSQATCVIVAALAAGASACGSRRPRGAFALLVTLAAAGILMAAVLVTLASQPQLSPSTRFPSWQVALIVGGAVASVWHGRALYRSSMQHLPRAAV